MNLLLRLSPLPVFLAASKSMQDCGWTAQLKTLFDYYLDPIERLCWDESPVATPEEEEQRAGICYSRWAIAHKDPYLGKDSV